MSVFYRGDCFEQMKRLPAKSIDFIYFNPPFATTCQWWDESLPWSAIFEQCFRLLKDVGTLAIHCSVPFNYTLIRAAPKPPNYSWYWDKQATTSPLLAKKQPLRCVEEILIWTNKVKYNPQRVGTQIRRVRQNRISSNYMNHATCIPKETTTVVGYYQTHLVSMPRHVRGFATRPDQLIELFIKSYTNEGDTILDPTCYKGLSGRIAGALGRRWIGIDKYFLPIELIST
jgi:site-specific DNA-methyltransferase (adenine-specific)